MAGGIFYHRFTTNFLLIRWWKNSENWSVFGKVSGKVSGKNRL